MPVPINRRFQFTGLLLFVICFAIINKDAYAILGAGDVVSDPISYSYYVEQIEAATEQIEQAKEQVENLAGLRDQVDNLTEQFRGNYNRALNLVNAVGDLYKEIDSIPSSFDAAENEFNSLTGDYEAYSKVDENLNKAFNDPRRKNYNPHLIDVYKYNLQQLDKKNVIRASEGILEKQRERIETLQDISGQIDTTENTKDATDLNNRFLAEIVRGQIEILAVLVRMSKMNALATYSGYEDDVAKERVKLLEDRANGKDDREFEYTKWLNSHGDK